MLWQRATRFRTFRNGAPKRFGMRHFVVIALTCLYFAIMMEICTKRGLDSVHA